MAPRKSSRARVKPPSGRRRSAEPPAVAGTAGAAAEQRRRVPTQERSKARYERILDAADAVFARVGYEAATTEEIAERAETSIGSVYQFFPHKRALFGALRERYLDRARELFDELLTPEAILRPWPLLLDDVVDAFWRFHCAAPGFRAVWIHQSITAEMLAAGDAMNRLLAARAADVMGTLAPQLSAERRGFVATSLVEMISALLFVAVRRDEPEAEALVAETKVMARAYLEAVLTGTR